MKDNKFITKIATTIVDRRKAFYFIYAALLIFCLFSMNWVNVNNSLTDYLPDSTETKVGLDLMEKEFTTYATASVMVDNISYEKAEKLKDELLKIEYVKSIDFDNTTKHYADGSALFSITFDGETEDETSRSAMKKINSYLADYDTYVSGEVGNSRSDTMGDDMKIILLIAVVIILLVLLFTSHTYMEIPVLIITFGVAALLNMGTNFIFGTISFVTKSIAVILQLALAIDYALILCHRYTEEREKTDQRSAVISALTKAIPEISGSSLTTLSGLAAMTFMQYKIGFDMGVVLIKAIIFSLLAVFTLMPGLLMSFGHLIDKTHHKSFVPSINVFGKIVVKLRYITTPIFAVVIVVGIFLSNMCPYAYGESDLTTIRESESKKAEHIIDNTFTRTNTIAMLVPAGDYAAEKRIISSIKKLDYVDSVTALGNIEADDYVLTDSLTPRQFSELAGIDIELARLLYTAYAANGEDYGRIIGGIENFKIPLIDIFMYAYEKIDEGYATLGDDAMADLADMYDQLTDAKMQLCGENYNRIVIQSSAPEEGEEAYAFLDELHSIADKQYSGTVYLVGNATSNRDQASSFARDNIVISVLSIVFVILVLLFTFQSAGLPILLILVIQGSIWINFSFPFLQSKPLFFMSYLVVSAIQMGANIDYAIVITNRYVDLKSKMPLREAIVETLNQAFPTIVTSGTILLSAGFIIGIVSSDPIVSSIGICLGRGTLISIVLVMLILPQLLIICDKLIDKTSFSLKLPLPAREDKDKSEVDKNE